MRLGSTADLVETSDRQSQTGTDASGDTTYAQHK